MSYDTNWHSGLSNSDSSSGREQLQRESHAAFKRPLVNNKKAPRHSEKACVRQNREERCIFNRHVQMQW